MFLLSEDMLSPDPAEPCLLCTVYSLYVSRTMALCITSGISSSSMMFVPVRVPSLMSLFFWSDKSLVLDTMSPTRRSPSLSSSDSCGVVLSPMGATIILPVRNVFGLFSSSESSASSSLLSSRESCEEFFAGPLSCPRDGTSSCSVSLVGRRGPSSRSIGVAHASSFSISSLSDRADSS